MAHRKSKTAAKARRRADTHTQAHTEDASSTQDVAPDEVAADTGRAANLAGTSAWSREVYDANGYLCLLYTSDAADE